MGMGKARRRHRRHICFIAMVVVPLRPMVAPAASNRRVRGTGGRLPQVRLKWVDVEDEDIAVGEVDVGDLFPTILIVMAKRRGSSAGNLPQAQVLGRMLQGMRATSARRPPMRRHRPFSGGLPRAGDRFLRNARCVP